MANCTNCGEHVSLDRSDVEIIDTLIAARLQQIRMPIGREGVIVTGSYDKRDGTVKVTFGDTAAMFPDTPDQQIDLPRIPLLTVHNGEQSGPRGNERVIVFEAQGGPVALLHHDEDDSPGAPSGEKWIQHRKADGTNDHSSKWTNDGSSAGDGLGGQLHSGMALHDVLTAGGLRTTHDDSAHAISQVAPNIGLGDKPANLDDTARAYSVRHMTAFEENLFSQRLQDYIKVIQTLNSVGALNNPASALSAIEAMILQHIQVPPGSKVTKIKPGTGMGASQFGLDAWGL